MTFAAPLGLLALLALPVVVVLHLFRRRFRERRAAGLFLFAPDALASDAGRRRTRLLRTPSLWLELLAAAAVALLLARPTLGDPARARHLVLALDGSASLAARGERGSADEAVRAFARAELRDLPADARATVVVTGVHPEVLAGPAARPADALAALDAWRPVAGDHDPGPALEVAAEIGGPEAVLVYLTDRADRAPPPRWRLVALGAAHDNAAVVGARRVRTGESERVFVDVRAFSSSPVRVRVDVRARPADGGGEGGRVLGSSEVAVDPDRTAHLSLEVRAADAPLEVTLSPDAFAVDDAAVLLSEPSPTVPVEVALPPAAAEALDVDRALEAVGGARRVSSAAEARLRFAASGDNAFVGTEVLVSTGEGEGDAWVGPFLVERDPLTRGLSLDGVVWTAGRSEPIGAPLVVAGERTLVSVEPGPRGTRVRLNLDPARSNLARSPDWPIFVANLLEAARSGLPGAGARNLRTGQEVAWRGARPDEPLAMTLVSPGGRRRAATGLGEVSWRAEEPGVHVLVDPGGSEVARFAVQFVDPAESDLRVRARTDEPPEAPATPGAGGAAAATGRGRVEASLLGLVLLLSLAADWWTLGRASPRRGGAS